MFFKSCNSFTRAHHKWNPAEVIEPVIDDEGEIIDSTAAGGLLTSSGTARAPFQHRYVKAFQILVVVLFAESKYFSSYDCMLICVALKLYFQYRLDPLKHQQSRRRLR